MSVRNSDIAELPDQSAETAKQPLQRALRRAAPRAFLWREEAQEMHRPETSLDRLSGIGPYPDKLIVGWLNDNSEVEGKIPDIRRNLRRGRTIRLKEPARLEQSAVIAKCTRSGARRSGFIQDMATRLSRVDIPISRLPIIPSNSRLKTGS